jgi:hypothetical protein
VRAPHHLRYFAPSRREVITAITIVSWVIHDRGMQANLTPVFLGITVWLTAIMLAFGRAGLPGTRGPPTGLSAGQ